MTGNPSAPLRACPPPPRASHAISQPPRASHAISQPRASAMLFHNHRAQANFTFSDNFACGAFLFFFARFAGLVARCAAALCARAAQANHRVMHRNKTRILSDLFPMNGLRGPSAKGGRAAGDQPREAGKEKKKSAAGETNRAILQPSRASHAILQPRCAAMQFHNRAVQPCNFTTTASQPCNFTTALCSHAILQPRCAAMQFHNHREPAMQFHNRAARPRNE